MNQVQNELAHYGVLGMKWGKHRARAAAKSAGKSFATAKAVRKETTRIVKEREDRAKRFEESGNSHENKGQNIRSALLKGLAVSDRSEARKIKRTGIDDAEEWMESFDRKKQRVDKLVAKYGDKELRAEVDSLIEKHKKTPYSYYMSEYEKDLTDRALGRETY